MQPAFASSSVRPEERNAIQRYLMEETRLGIPAIFVTRGSTG
ncbi:MAG: hypothetical protein R2751_19535 [Bacteroidales bacterium]